MLTRRNIVSRGVPLIELLDRPEFMVGKVLCAHPFFEPAATLSLSPSCRKFSKLWNTAAV
jgi:hypothetical protein